MIATSTVDNMADRRPNPNAERSQLTEATDARRPVLGVQASRWASTPAPQRPQHEARIQDLESQLAARDDEVRELRQQINAQRYTIWHQSQVIQGRTPAIGGVPPSSITGPSTGVLPQGSQASGNSSFTVLPDSAARRIYSSNPSTTQRTLDTAKMLEKMFDMAEKYALAHLNNAACPSQDREMQNAHRQLLINAVLNKAESEMWALLGGSQTRHLLAQRGLVEWSCHTVLRSSAFEGFAPDLDHAIRQARDSVFQSTPKQLKETYLNKIASCLQEILALDGFHYWVARICRDRGNSIWPFLKALMPKKTTRDWDDLIQFLQEAHQLPLQMFQGSEEYSLNFMAPGVQFDSARMVNRTPALRHWTPAQIEKQQLQVRLVITPLVEMRTSTAQEVSATTLVKARVLLRYSGAA